MKKFIVLALATCALAPAFAQTSVGVSIGVNQPGMYGRIDIGNYPPPQVIHAQPVIIAPTPVARHQQPIYLYVPPGHQKKWDKHCHRYNACGQPVYFVQENWVRERYEERRSNEGRGKRGHEGRGNSEHGRDRDRDDDRGGEGNRGRGGRGER